MLAKRYEKEIGVKCTQTEPPYSKKIEIKAMELIASYNADCIRTRMTKPVFDPKAIDNSSIESSEEQSVMEEKLFTGFSVEDEYDRLSEVSKNAETADNDDDLLKINKWRLNKKEKKVELHCTWRRDGKQWDAFKTLQSDCAEAVGQYVSEDIELWKKILVYNLPLCDEIKPYISFKQEDFMLEQLIEEEDFTRTKAVTQMEVALTICKKDHNDLHNFVELDKHEWFKEGTVLFGTKCHKCEKNISDMKVCAKEPARVCDQHGNQGCCACICFSCTNALQKTAVIKKRKRV
jgi:hypothetical protein